MWNIRKLSQIFYKDQIVNKLDVFYKKYYSTQALDRTNELIYLLTHFINSNYPKATPCYLYWKDNSCNVLVVRIKNKKYFMNLLNYEKIKIKYCS